MDVGQAVARVGDRGLGAELERHQRRGRQPRDAVPETHPDRHAADATPQAYGPRMGQIETLEGPLDTADLGTVLMHEHIFNLTAEIQIVHPGFNGWDPEVWVPLDLASEVQRVGRHAMRVIGRLKDVTLPEAQAALDVAARQVERAYPQDNAGHGVRVASLAETVMGRVLSVKSALK